MKARWVWPVPLMLALLWLGGFVWFVKAAQDSAATMDRSAGPIGVAAVALALEAAARARAS